MIEFSDAPALLAFVRPRDRWGEAVPGTAEPVFPRLPSQEDSTLLELLAFCAADAIHAVSGRERQGDCLGDVLAKALDLDMADSWSPTPADYLASVPKAQLVEVVTEACGADAAKPLAAMRKAEAVSYPLPSFVAGGGC